MKKIIALAMALGILSSILVGCSSGSTDAASTDTASATPKDSTPKDKEGE